MEKTDRIPARLIVLDGIGTIVLVLGFLNEFVQEKIPEAIRMANYGMVLIVVGLVLILPGFLHRLGMKRAKEKAPMP